MQFYLWLPRKLTLGLLGEETAGDIFFTGWLVRKDFKLYGSLVSDQIKLHGWLVFRCVEGEERILSAKKREFYQSSQKKALSLANPSRNGHFCLHAIVKPLMFPSNIGKKGTEINSPIVASVGVITSLGNHVFSEELIQGNNARRFRVVRPLVKANTYKNLYQ